MTVDQVVAGLAVTSPHLHSSAFIVQVVKSYRGFKGDFAILGQRHPYYPGVFTFETVDIFSLKAVTDFRVIVEVAREYGDYLEFERRTETGASIDGQRRNFKKGAVVDQDGITYMILSAPSRDWHKLYSAKQILPDAPGSPRIALSHFNISECADLQKLVLGHKRYAHFKNRSKGYYKGVDRAYQKWIAELKERQKKARKK